MMNMRFQSSNYHQVITPLLSKKKSIRYLFTIDKATYKASISSDIFNFDYQLVSKGWFRAIFGKKVVKNQ